MKILQSYEFSGIDACIETSLYEYGLIWKYLGDNKYHFIYGISVNDTDLGPCYNKFDHCTLESNQDIFDLFDWIDDKDSFLSFVGMSMKEFLEKEFPYQIYDMVSYYGYQNIFGSSYWSMQVILQDEEGDGITWDGEIIEYKKLVNL